MTGLAERAGRAALAWVFLRAGADVLAHPERPATTAGPFLARLRDRSPVTLPAGDVSVIRANAAVQVGAAALLAAGVAVRPAAAVLAGSLVPTTVAGHAFWAVDDPTLRPNQRNHFNKNLAIVGALTMVAAGRRRPARPSGG